MIYFEDVKGKVYDSQDIKKAVWITFSRKLDTDEQVRDFIKFNKNQMPFIKEVKIKTLNDFIDHNMKSEAIKFYYDNTNKGKEWGDSSRITLVQAKNYIDKLFEENNNNNNKYVNS